SGYTDKGGHHSGDFLRISHIIRNVQNDGVILRGIRLRRTMFFNGMLERKLNEVAIVIHSDADDARPALQQGLEEVSLEEVVAVRELILTNHKFPSLSFRDEVFWNGKPIWATNLLDMDYKTQAPLVCRWVVNYVYEDPTTRKKGLLGHTMIRTLQEAECDEKLSIPDSELRSQWRNDNAKEQLSHHREEKEMANQLKRYRAQRRNRSNAKLEQAMSGLSIADAMDVDDPGTSITPSRTPLEEVVDLTIDQDKEEIETMESEKITRHLSSRGTYVRHMRTSCVESFTPAPAKTTQAAINLDDECAPTSVSRKRVRFEEPPSNLASTKRPTLRISSLPDESQILEFSVNTHQPSDASPLKRAGPAISPPEITFIDVFSGAGGVSRGAISVGLKIRSAIDSDKAACDTYIANFPATNVFQMLVQDFPPPDFDCYHVVAHFSPPCQYFSPAHTRAGQNDDANTAALFTLSPQLCNARPYVGTMEETSGLITHHREYMHAAIQMFTHNGCSVVWKLCNFAEYGLVQPRKRVLLMFAAPGCPLPPLPIPTHGPKSPSRRPFVTIHEAISNIPVDSPYHVPEFYSVADRRRPYNPHQQLKGCILTTGVKGAHNYHPSGLRKWTVHELARLQGFPDEHVWGEKGAIKQIGNAFPPVIAKCFLASVKNVAEQILCEIAGAPAEIRQTSNRVEWKPAPGSQWVRKDQTVAI
ncbi:hypothetical protein B0A49_13119, partial [Cryomyces minteri]